MGRNSYVSRVNAAAAAGRPAANGSRANARMAIHTSWLHATGDVTPHKIARNRNARGRTPSSKCESAPKTYSTKPKTYAEAISKARSAPFAGRLETGAAMLPHPAKAAKGGEDAYFVAGNSFGIADGVGGWEVHGIDSGLYSRSLMKFACEAALRETDPLAILKFAHARSAPVPGSSTACVLSLKGNLLEAANLGDSGFMVVRQGKVVYKTREQQHYFNCPFQIGNSRDTPADADLIKIPMENGDYIVAATDGVFDNLSSEQILRLVLSGVNHHRGTTEIAQAIATEAQRVAHDPRAETPFSISARKVGQSWIGGKLDDITVLVSRVELRKAQTQVQPPTEAQATRPTTAVAAAAAAAVVASSSTEDVEMSDAAPAERQ